MDNKVLNRIIAILETAVEFYVPVKKLWKDLKEEGYVLPPLEDFLHGLQSDPQFEVREFGKKGAPAEENDSEHESEMEALGFYSGPRAKLAKRIITKEDMQVIALKHAQNTIDNLIKAYQARPDDLPPESEDELIELMRKSKALKEEIDKVFRKNSE